MLCNTHLRSYWAESNQIKSNKERHRLSLSREIHPLDPQPHRHSMLVTRVCAPRVTRCSLGKYWSRDFFQKKAGRMLAGIQACATGFAAISVWPRACETSRQPILGYTGYLWLIVVWGSEIWWCMHSAHSLSTTLRSETEESNEGTKALQLLRFLF